MLSPPLARSSLPYDRCVRSRLARPIVIIPLALLLVLVVAGTWFWARAGSSTPVSAAAALREYGAGGSSAPSGPRPGAYTYLATGAERVSLGPLGVNRDLPGAARIVVRGSAGGYWRTLVLSEEHVEGTRFRVGEDGAREVQRLTIVKVVGVGREDVVDLKPPPLSYPARIRVGDTWHERYHLAEVVVDSHVRVMGREDVSVGGTAVPALIIRTRALITGPFPGRRTDVMWWSPALAMPVRWKIDMDIGGAASLATHADLLLTSPDPTR